MALVLAGVHGHEDGVSSGERQRWMWFGSHLGSRPHSWILEMGFLVEVKTCVALPRPTAATPSGAVTFLKAPSRRFPLSLTDALGETLDPLDRATAVLGCCSLLEGVALEFTFVSLRW